MYLKLLSLKASMIELITMFDMKIYLILLILFLHFSTRALINFKNKKYIKFEVQDLNNDPRKCLRYLDKYYITNKYYTFSCVLLYFMFNIGIVLYLRFRTIIGNTKDNITFPIDQAVIHIKYSTVFSLLFYLILIITLIIIFKRLLDVLFFDEVLKLHLYLGTKEYYCKLTRSILPPYLFTEIFGPCYLFFYNICTLQTVTHFIDTLDNTFNEYNNIYDNQRICLISTYLVNMAKKYSVLLWVFKFIRNVFKWLYYHMTLNRLVKYLPFMIFILIAFYDLIHLQFYYTIYAFFPIYILTLILQLMKFSSTRDPIIDGTLSRYFYGDRFDYNNFFNYAAERSYLIDDTFKELNIKKSYALSELFHNLGAYSAYVLNNLEDVLKENPLILLLNSQYKRYVIIIISLILTIYFIINQKTYGIYITYIDTKISIIYLLLPVLAMLIYSSNKAFNLPKGTDYYMISTFTYSKNYNRLFWIITIIQIYIYWILVIKANMIIVDDGVLWKSLSIEIIKYYTIEEKLAFFHHYFDFYMKIHSMPEEAIEAIKLSLEKLNLKDLVKQRSIGEIKLYIESLLVDYLNQLENLETAYFNKLYDFMTIRTTMDGISNIINIICLWEFFTMYLKAYIFVINPHSSAMVKFLYTLIKLINK